MPVARTYEDVLAEYTARRREGEARRDVIFKLLLEEPDLPRAFILRALRTVDGLSAREALEEVLAAMGDEKSS